jgi:hypothetical protein
MFKSPISLGEGLRYYNGFILATIFFLNNLKITYMKNTISALIISFLFASASNAQQMNGMQMSDTAKPKDKSMNMQMNGMNMNDTKEPKDTNMDMQMNGMQMNDTAKPKDKGMNMQMTNNSMTVHMTMNMDNMSYAFSINLPMSRDGSGTGWMPDASPMHGIMYQSKKWTYMLHYNLFIRYNNQDFTNKGSRGNDKADAPNWLMFMGQKKVGSNGLFHFNTMFSLDAVTMGGGGYPLLFQSGENYKGKPLVDRQHPHDLFSELSVSYAYSFSKKTDFFIYVGYPGEPALGPVAFMHRPSALYNPDAPLSHHWADATHITFGVATLGFRYKDFKIEGSSFTGREPDEHRFNFDRARFDSWSGRLSYNPLKNWALQVSHGFLKSPEALHPGEDVNRTTASAIYSLPLSNNGWFNAIALWGMNKIKGQDVENAFLLEASFRKNKFALYTRYEYVQKSVDELNLDETMYAKNALFPVNAATLGFNYDLLHVGKTKIAGGGQFTFYSADNRLNSLYGKNPLAFEVFLRLYPAIMKM